MNTPNLKNNNTRQVVQFYWGCVRAYPKRVAGILINVPLTVLINGYLPALILANVLSKLSQHQFQAGHLWASFGPPLVAYAVLLLSGIGMWRLTDWFSWHLEQDIGRDGVDLDQ